MPPPITVMIKFSNLEIRDSDLQPESITTINENVQSWARVVISLSEYSFFDDPAAKCIEWLSENATDDYRIIHQQSNNYNHKNKYINNLVIRFKDPSDAVLFRLTDPLADDTSPLPF